MSRLVAVIHGFSTVPVNYRLDANVIISLPVWIDWCHAMHENSCRVMIVGPRSPTHFSATISHYHRCQGLGLASLSGRCQPHKPCTYFILLFSPLTPDHVSREKKTPCPTSTPFVLTHKRRTRLRELAASLEDGHPPYY